MDMANGSCLCGAIRYRAEGPFESMLHCHCSRCRRHHGSPYATFVGAASAGFAWLAGRERIATYTAASGMPRFYCPDCGAVVPAPETQGATHWMPAGNLDACDARPAGHMYATSKATWWTISDDLARYDGPPPGYPDPNVPSPTPETSPGTIGGGCLCAAVRYEITPPPIVMVNCHCSRCRRARAAAHATNLFVGTDQLRITQGAERVRVFDLPGAERFGQNFCADCGGKAPRLSPKIGRWVVPAGTLDGDPGIRPGLHIFVGSKAAWDAIADGLPQFEAAAP
jgi:hypothetical protein